MTRYFLLLLFLSIGTFTFAQIGTTTSKDCYLLYDYDGKEFLKNKKLKAGTPIVVYQEMKGLESFYEVEYKNIKGCLKENCIFVNEEIGALFQIKANKLAAEKREKEKADSIQEAKSQKIWRETFGKWEGHIKRKEIVIGMPEPCIRMILGQPETVNTSEYSFGTHSQYVYKNMYIYTKDGVIDAIQRISH